MSIKSDADPLDLRDIGAANPDIVAKLKAELEVWKNMVERNKLPQADAEEIIVITRGQGTAILEEEERVVMAEDVIYVPPCGEHEIRHTSDDFLVVLFINVPVGEGLDKLRAAQQ